MNKYKHILFLFGIFLFANNYAQLNNFDLSKYKLPDLERRALETNFNFSGNNRINSSSDQATKSATNSFNNNIFVGYDYYLNTAEIQRNSEINFALSSRILRYKADKEIYSKNFYIEPSISYLSNNRKYFSQKYFLEYDIDAYYQFENNRTHYEYDNPTYEKRKDQEHYLKTSFPLKIGKGRIEPIQDARHAIYIFEELSKIDRMSPDKTNEEIIEFASFISKLKNERFFDSRLKRIAEIESVDSFFIAKNYLEKSDAKYFATLMDFWGYGNGPYRNNGTRFSFGIIPGYYYFNRNAEYDETDYNYIKHAFQLNGGIEFIHEKPINLYWQSTTVFNGYVGYIDGEFNDKFNSNKNKVKVPDIQLQFEQAIGFVPNTRTYANFSFGAMYAQLFDRSDKGDDILQVAGKAVELSTGISVSYYISPRFRLNFSSSIQYNWFDSENNAFIDLYYNIIDNQYRLLDNLPFNGSSNTNYYDKDFRHTTSLRLSYSIF